MALWKLCVVQGESAGIVTCVTFCNSAGQNSNTAKLKTLSGALEIMVETRHAFQLIHKELLEEQSEVPNSTPGGHTQKQARASPLVAGGGGLSFVSLQAVLEISLNLSNE